MLFSFNTALQKSGAYPTAPPPAIYVPDGKS